MRTSWRGEGFEKASSREEALDGISCSFLSLVSLDAPAVYPTSVNSGLGGLGRRDRAAPVQAQSRLLSELCARRVPVDSESLLCLKGSWREAIPQTHSISGVEDKEEQGNQHGQGSMNYAPRTSPYSILLITPRGRSFIPPYFTKEQSDSQTFLQLASARTRMLVKNFLTKPVWVLFVCLAFCLLACLFTLVSGRESRVSVQFYKPLPTAFCFLGTKEENHQNFLKGLRIWSNCF